VSLRRCWVQIFSSAPCSLKRHPSIWSFQKVRSRSRRHYQWRYSPESGLGLPYGFRDRYITMWVISPTISLVLVILIQPPETSSSEACETRVRNMVAEFCLRASVHARRVLLHAVNLRHGTDGFTSPPKEGVLRILSPLKIHHPRPGLNPRTLGPVAGTLTTRPPRATRSQVCP
jgi:hypothetical protein